MLSQPRTRRHQYYRIRQSQGVYNCTSTNCDSTQSHRNRKKKGKLMTRIKAEFGTDHTETELRFKECTDERKTGEARFLIKEEKNRELAKEK